MLLFLAHFFVSFEGLFFDLLFVEVRGVICVEIANLPFLLDDAQHRRYVIEN